MRLVQGDPVSQEKFIGGGAAKAAIGIQVCQVRSVTQVRQSCTQESGIIGIVGRGLHLGN
jgi:hypothetical protein